MRLEDYDFHLPPELIAKHPTERREDSRLLVVDRKQQKITHHAFKELPTFFTSGDLVVRNISKVIPARFYIPTPAGGKIEILLLHPLENNLEWLALAKPGKKLRKISEVFHQGAELHIQPKEEGFFQIRFVLQNEKELLEWLDKNGEVPLPPYLKRRAESQDRHRYQTLYAQSAGSVAAPTAGLHFSEAILKELQTNGIAFSDVTLHVGYGTFAPLTEKELGEKKLHRERFSVPEGLMTEIADRIQKKQKVLAVGTTTLRALESAIRMGNEGFTDLFIQPGDPIYFQGSLLTNFHLPQSSLLLLVSAFAGRELIQEAYQQAISEGYRFYSFGDAMLIL